MTGLPAVRNQLVPCQHHGLAPFHGMRERSIAPDMETLTDHSTGAILVEDDQQRPALGFDYLPRVHSPVTERYRLSIHDNTDRGEIYALELDPLENSNLRDEPSAASVKAKLLEKWRASIFDSSTGFRCQINSPDPPVARIGSLRTDRRERPLAARAACSTLMTIQAT